MTETISIPLIGFDGWVSTLLLILAIVCALGILSIAIFVSPDTKSSVPLIMFSSFFFGALGLCIAAVVFSAVDTSQVRGERTVAIESALDGRIIDGSVTQDGLLLVERDGVITRVSFNVADDAGLMLLTPIGVGGVEDE